MRVITVAGTKGGIGKSTSTSVLADRLLAAGQEVHIVDLDPQNDQESFVTKAQERVGDQLSLTTFNDLLGMQSRSIETNFYEIVSAQRSAPGILLVDVQGSDSNLLGAAVIEADLVLIPMVDSDKEIKGVIDTIETLANIARKTRDALNVYFFWNEARGIGSSKEARELEDALKDQGHKVLGHNLLNRAAFGNVGKTGTVKSDKPDMHLKAIQEANEWAEAIAEALGDASND